MLGRLPGATGRLRFNDLVAEMLPLRTPGPTGYRDAHDPNVPGAQGDSPGPMGHGDYAEAAANVYPQWVSKRFSNRLRKYAPKDIDLAQLREQLERHEGKRTKAYKDTKGHPTVGIGFNLDRPDAKQKIEALKLDFARVRAGQVTLTEAQIQQLFDADVAQAMTDARALVKNFNDLPAEKKMVVIDMIFNLGPAGFGKFHKLIKALEGEDYARAALEMRHSAWYGQVGDRSKELVKMMDPKTHYEPVLKKKQTPQLKRTEPPPPVIQMLGLRGRKGTGRG
jgi:GH24 family phage-related lysozyme (muramidase)